MGQSPQLIRMSYTKHLYDFMFSYVFTDRTRLQREAIEIVVADNQTLLKCNTPTFIFNGLWYPEAVRTIGNDIRKQCNKQLHPSLRKRMQDLLEINDFDDQVIQAGIRTLFGNILMLAKHKEDLTRLLPSDLMLAISPVDTTVFNTADPLSDDIINSFLDNNKENFGYLRRLIITRLLLARI